MLTFIDFLYDKFRKSLNFSASIGIVLHIIQKFSFKLFLIAEVSTYYDELATFLSDGAELTFVSKISIKPSDVNIDAGRRIEKKQFSIQTSSRCALSISGSSVSYTLATSVSASQFVY